MTSPFLIKGQGFAEGRVDVASPATSALRWITLARLGVLANRPFDGTTGDREAVLDILSGTVNLEVDGQRYEGLGRSDPFTAGPTLLCLPPSTTYRLTSDTPTADLLIAEAPTSDPQALTVVRPADAPERAVGAANWGRRVWPGTSVAPGSSRLLVGETLNPPGNWSSYPPHKHDTENPPVEAVYEEVYFFLVKPPGGFGIQRIYERQEAPDAIDEVFVVEDGDAVVLPRGYHPVVAAPGYSLCYVWALCGSGRSYGAWSDDPAHAWVRNVEPLLAKR